MSNKVRLSTVRGQQVIDVLTDDRFWGIECFEKFEAKKPVLDLHEKAFADHRRSTPAYRRDKLEG